MNKEIRDYQESMFWGLSFRQCLFSVLAILAALGIYFLTRKYAGEQVTGWLCVLGAAPFAACGFFRYHGMTAEQFAWAVIKSELLYPKRLVFKSEKGICYSEEVLKERKKELHTHSIECLYKLACDKKNIDRRIPAYFENIEDMIYFYYFDEEGDAFKYELNKEDEPHMIKNKISHVSIELLETEFKEVMKKFDDLIYFLDNCIFEYSLGTFTKSLSRADIWDISKRLPVYEEWRTEKFKEVKDEIKQEYHLGSKEFSDAVNLIKENREFSVNIGCEKVFGSITENELKEYASLVRYYSEKSKSDNKGKEIGFDLRKIQKNGEILKKYLSSISMNTLNTLLCFSEMSNSFLAVEHLEEVHDDIVSKAFDGTYLIRKLKQRNICLRILYGMKKCGQVTYAKQLSAALEQEGVELTL